MFARALSCKQQRWYHCFRLYKRGISHTPCSHIRSVGDQQSLGSSLNKSIPKPYLLSDTTLGCRAGLRWGAMRLYSSKGDEGNASDDKHVPVEDSGNVDKGEVRKQKVNVDANRISAHARLGEEDQKEWLRNERLAIESKKKDSPFLSRRERFKNEFLRRVVPPNKITVSWDTFPYHIHEHTKSVLVECAMSNLKNKKVTASYGSRLPSSSGRILLQSTPGTELYRERLVRALAKDLQVPLLVLDSNVLAPYDFGEHYISESESEDENAESGSESTSDSEVDDENNASDEEQAGGSEVKSDGEDEVHTAAEALKKLARYSLDDFAKNVSGDAGSSSESSTPETVQPSEQYKRPIRKGDRVKYVGASARVEADNRSVPSGQRGEVYEVNGDRVAVILDSNHQKTEGAKVDEKNTDEAGTPPVYWIHIQDIEHDPDTQAEDWYLATEALFEILPSLEPIIVYFPDTSQWLSRAVPKSNRKDFVNKVEELLNQLSGPVVFICGQNKVETGSKEKEKFTMILPNVGRLSKLPLTLKNLTEGLKPSKRSDDYELFKLFTNVICIHPPKDEELFRTFSKQVEEDRKFVISRSNLNELNKVLEEHELACVELLLVDTEGVFLTKQRAEQVIGWAKNHYLSSCSHPSIKRDRLNLPRESLEIAINRLKEQEMVSAKPTQSLKGLAKDEYESNFISSVVPPGEIGVKFEDIGALDDVKRTLNELVTLPMRRPELFSHGNLLRPCKGILLFGPPGTGKTLLAKALATEAEANFISITGSTLTSKWFGDAEKLTKALFSFASKLAPVIIFVDEVDSLLGARGGGFEHEATRRMRNEFMAAWDGLRTKDNQRILILGATNRPFDLDDAVIRRLPRRIYVDLPDAENRMKILKIFLSQENLEPDFKYDELANSTEGYSGSDLKNLCIAAAYRPVQELLEKESKDGVKSVASALRPLSLNDFIHAKAKVGASVAYDATSMNELRKWNEQYGEGGSRKTSPFGFVN